MAKATVDDNYYPNILNDKFPAPIAWFNVIVGGHKSLFHEVPFVDVTCSSQIMLKRSICNCVNLLKLFLGTNDFFLLVLGKVKCPVYNKWRQHYHQCGT